MKLSSQTIQNIRNYFLDKPVLKVYLFGSYARGEADESSDVDILVDYDYVPGISMIIPRIHFGLEDLLGKKVDLVPMKYVKPKLLPFINADKILIYERPAPERRASA